MKRPSFQFYPGDWLRDTALRSCSVGARGLWIDMLCLMHDGEPYGHLKVGRKVIHTDNLARILGATLAEVEGWLQELADARVYDKDKDGAIFSRRMVRDEEIRAKRAAGGGLGGNPVLMKHTEPNVKVNHKDNLAANLQPTLGITPSSSSSSSSANNERGRNDSKMSDAEWMSSLSENPAYTGIDVQREFGRMQAWCQQNNKKPSRRRFVNWLNRIDKPMAVSFQSLTLAEKEMAALARRAQSLQ